MKVSFPDHVHEDLQCAKSHQSGGRKTGRQSKPTHAIDGLRVKLQNHRADNGRDGATVRLAASDTETGV